MVKKIIFVFAFASVQFLNAQQYDLTFLCDVMVNAYEGKHRVVAGNEFNRLFEEELKKSGSFANPFSELKWVSIKSDVAQTFRIFTWQIRDEKNIHKSYGFIQMKNGGLFELNDNVTAINKDLEYESMDANNWLGCMYYNMREFKTDKGNAFLLFGYDGLDDKNRLKIIEVLTFENGKPVFGADVFKIKDGARPDLKYRILVDYSALANVNCNYNEGMEMVVHDYVVTRMGISTDGSPAKIPDGTYVGYQWDGKTWNFIEQLAHQVSNPEDIFYQPKAKEEVKKDLFGRKKN
jgi:hypothetical protein